jgi:hypothetical protein
MVYVEATISMGQFAALLAIAWRIWRPPER